MNLNPFRHKDLPSLGNAEREVVDEFRRLETFTESLILQLASWTASDIAYDPTSDAYSASETVQEALEDHAAALDAHEGAGGTTRHPVFTTAVEGFVPAPGSLVDASAYFLAANGSWIGHRTVGGTSEHAVFTTSVAGFVPAPSSALGRLLKDDGTWQYHHGLGGTAYHPVFTTSVAGFVPAPTSATGKYLRDDGTWVAPSGGATFGWGEAVCTSNLDFSVGTTSYYTISSASFSSGLSVNTSRSNGSLASIGLSGTIRAKATINLNVNLEYGAIGVDTLLYVRFYNSTAGTQFGSGELVTKLGPYTEKDHINLTFSTVGSLSNSQYIVAQFKWTTTGGGAVSDDLRINPVNFTLEPIGV